MLGQIAPTLVGLSRDDLGLMWLPRQGCCGGRTNRDVSAAALEREACMWELDGGRGPDRGRPMRLSGEQMIGGLEEE